MIIENRFIIFYKGTLIYMFSKMVMDLSKLVCSEELSTSDNTYSPYLIFCYIPMLITSSYFQRNSPFHGNTQAVCHICFASHTIHQSFPLSMVHTRTYFLWISRLLICYNWLSQLVLGHQKSLSQTLFT